MLQSLDVFNANAYLICLKHHQNTFIFKLEFALTAFDRIVVHVIIKDVHQHRFLRCVLLHITVQQGVIHQLARHNSRPMYCPDQRHQPLHRVIRHAIRHMAIERDPRQCIILPATGHLHTRLRPVLIVIMLVQVEAVVMKL